MKEAILNNLSLLTILHGIDCSTKLILARGTETFMSFFTTIFINGIETMDETVRKVEVYGISQMLLKEQSFYQQPFTTLAQGILAMMRAVLRDVNKNWTDSSNFLDIPVEYDACGRSSGGSGGRTSVAGAATGGQQAGSTHSARDLQKVTTRNCLAHFRSPPM